MVPEPDHPVSFTHQKFRPARIIALLVRVLTAVEFDDQLRSWADEVGDVIADRDLPAEFRSVQSTGAQSGPELCFRLGRFTSHPSGTIQQQVGGFAATQRPLSLALRACPSTLEGEG